MLEVATALSLASQAFKGIKAAVQAGRELEDCMSQLSQWAGAIADLDKSDELIKKKKSSLFRSLLPTNGMSVEQQAMEAFAAKQTARKQREELRQLIQYTTGKQGWEEFLRMEARIRQEKRSAIYAEIDRREKLKELALGALIIILGIGTLGLGIWLMVMLKGAN